MLSANNSFGDFYTATVLNKQKETNTEELKRLKC